MSKILTQLIYFVIYSLVFLVIGKLSFSESDSVSKFFVGERKNDVRRLFFTFVGTWVSAATILGFTGNVYHNGTNVIATSVIPWFIGSIFLYLISDRLYENDIVSIPELIRKKYDSVGLQILCALLMIGAYIFYLIIQIKGFGIAASSLLNIDYTVAIFLVYLFILYSSFGGFNSVTKSDTLNLIMLTISVVVLYFAIVGRIDGHWYLNNEIVHNLLQTRGEFPQNTITSGIPEFLVYFTSFFGWGMGLATNPQYMIRLVAAKDKKTAKQMILYSLAFLALLYFGLTQIGLGLRVLFPQLKAYCPADDVFVYAVTHLMYSGFSGFFLISVIGACVSTANSQLHLIGSMLSYDVMAQLSKKKMSEEKILLWARVFVFVGGTIALILSISPPEDAFSLGADVWGIFSAVLTPILYGALLLKKRSKKAAYAAFVTGLVCSLMFSMMNLEIYWAFPATVCSTAIYLAITAHERRNGGTV